MDLLNLVRTEDAGRDARDILRASPEALLGVTPAAAAAMRKLDINTVFDLANSRIFRSAELLREAALDPASVWARFGVPPSDTVEPGFEEGALRELPSRDLGVLDGIGPALAKEISAALSVPTLRDFSLYPPYLAAKRIYRDTLLPETADGFEPGEPGNLLPKLGEYPTEQVQYKTLLLDRILGDDPALQDLETGGPIDISVSAKPDFGFKHPALGAVITFTQSWYAQALTLGQLLHSVALAPGESTRIAVVDWSRRTRGSQVESVSETESLSNSTNHARAISEVTEGVAVESQSGFSRAHMAGSSGQTGTSSGFSLGPITLGGSSSGGMVNSDAWSFSTSGGRRDLAASMNQNVIDSTHQQANAVRNRRASVVREVSQSEHESVSTRVLTNYNHMHALTVQYFEVVQVYRVEVKISEVERCLFVPMKLLDFRDQALIQKYRSALAAAALDERARRMLTTDFGVVEIESHVPLAWPVSKLAASILDEHGASALLQDQLPAAAAAAASVAEPRAAAAGAAVAGALESPKVMSVLELTTARGFDRVQIESAASILGRPVLRPGSQSIFVPDEAELVSLMIRDTQASSFQVETKEGSVLAFSAASSLSATLEKAVPVRELASISVGNPHMRALGARLSLVLTYLGSTFPIDVPIHLENKGAGTPQQVVAFGSSRASNELMDHLEENRLHYSQAVFRAIDPASMALLLSPHGFRGKPLAQVVDPLPITITGNYLVFRMHTAAAADSADPEEKEWAQWLDDRGIDLKWIEESLVPLPSGGVFAEAVLGRSNCAEKLDITRFWNWQDSPIPIQAPEIAAVQMGSRGTAEDLKATPLGAPVVSIVNPTALPDPVGMAGVLQAIQNGNMFRDMSGLAATIGLAQAGGQQATEGSIAAGQIASSNMATAAKKEVEMFKAALAFAATMMGRGSPDTSPSTISSEGAKINHGRSLDNRAAGAGAGSSGGGAPGPILSESSSDATGSNGTANRWAPEDEPAGGGGSSENQAFQRALWGSTGTSDADLFQRVIGPGASAGSSSGMAIPQPTKLAGSFVAESLQLLFKDADDINAWFQTFGGQPFIPWFNAHVANRGPWSKKAIGSGAVVEGNFKAIWDKIPQMFGTAEINLLQFASLMSIFVNEVGDTLLPISEKVGLAGHPGIAYAFDAIPGLKVSYNNGGSNWTAFRCFNDPDFLAAHGSKLLGSVLRNTTDQRWKGDVYPSGVSTSPDPNVTGFILEADFFKFRGRGLIQTTWRGNYAGLISFVQGYTGTQAEILSRKAAWSGMSVDKAASVSSNADWDDLFMKTNLEIACEGVARHNASRGNYLSLAGDVSRLNGTGNGSIRNMGLLISGGKDYADLFFKRVVALCNRLGNDDSTSI